MLLNKWILKRNLQNGKAGTKGCFLTLTRALDYKASGLWLQHNDLGREGSVMNPIYLDLGEAFDTVSHEVTIVKSTATYVATRTTQELSRLARKTLAISTSMWRKEPQGIVFNLYSKVTEIIHTVIIKFAQNINWGGCVKRANEGEPIDLVQFHFCAPFNFQGGARMPNG